MGVTSKIIRVYTCTCEKCGVSQEVKASETIYNGAQAVRSLGWKYGKDKSVKCSECRRHDWDDHYQYIAEYKQKQKSATS